MKKGLADGTMSEADTAFVRTALAKAEKKLAEVLVQIDSDGNKAQEQANKELEKDAQISDVKQSIADLDMKIAAREGEINSAVENVSGVINEE